MYFSYIKEFLNLPPYVNDSNVINQGQGLEKANMDPWFNTNKSVKPENNQFLQEFEDNFRPIVDYKLPDSEQYLAALGKSESNAFHAPKNAFFQRKSCAKLRTIPISCDSWLKNGRIACTS